jgi:nucleoside-diphosphate-sugar epimerase
MHIPYESFLVTGGAGFIGSHLVEYLSKNNKHVTVLDNFVSGKRENLAGINCDIVEGSITDRDLVFELVSKADVVFNEAASKCTVCYDDPQLDMMVNGIGTLYVAQACNEYDKRLVHASSGSVMDGTPNSYYGISKWAGENYIRQHEKYSLQRMSTILRYYHVYGTRQDDSNSGGVIPIFIRRIYNNEPVVIFGTGNQVRHFTSVYDVVNANITVLVNNYSNIVYNVVSNVKITIDDLAIMIYDIFGKPCEIYHELPKRGDIFLFPNIYDIQIPIGYIDNFRKELERTIEWYVNKYEQEKK